MGCWKCECGYRNCDIDECQNPKCSCKGSVKHEVHEQQLKKNLEGIVTGTYPCASDADHKNFIREDI